MSHKHLLIVLLVLTLIFSACSLDSTGRAPLVWIDAPGDGASVALGTSVAVMAHASSNLGRVSQMALLVNDVPVINLALAPMISGVEGRGTWTPIMSGTYNLQVRATAADGSSATSASVSVLVSGAPTPAPLLYATHTPTPTFTPITPLALPATRTPTPTFTPITPLALPATRTPTPTFTPITPLALPATRTPTHTPTPTFTRTPWPPAQVNFRADNTSLTSGQCTTLRWDVEYAAVVYLDGSGVAGHGTRQVCPNSTTTYRLHVEAPSGNVDRQVTITVSVPADTSGPTISNITESNDPIKWPPQCMPNQVTISAFVSDPSGVGMVKLNYRVVEGSRQGTWRSEGMSLTGTSIYATTIIASELQASLNPPVNKVSTLEYYIQAFDTKGNQSTSPTRTVRIDYCLY